MTDLERLTARVEALAGPCRETDGAVWCSLHGDTEMVIGTKPGRFPQEPIMGPAREIADCEGFADYVSAPAFTASLDAAMTLVPEGWLLSELHERNATGVQNWRWKAALWHAHAARQIGQDAPTVVAYARKAHDAKCAPALALTAAALRALAAQEQEKNND